MSSSAPSRRADEDDSPHLTLSPAVRRIVLEHHLDPSRIKGTGKDGRLTKDDVLAAAAKAQGGRRPAPPPPPARGRRAPAAGRAPRASRASAARSGCG